MQVVPAHKPMPPPLRRHARPVVAMVQLVRAHVLPDQTLPVPQLGMLVLPVDEEAEEMLLPVVEAEPLLDVTDEEPELTTVDDPTPTLDDDPTLIPEEDVTPDRLVAVDVAPWVAWEEEPLLAVVAPPPSVPVGLDALDEQAAVGRARSKAANQVERVIVRTRVRAAPASPPPET